MRKCLHCNKYFIPNYGIEKYCSKKCYHNSTKIEKITKKCEECGKEMEVKNSSTGKERRFCSRECYYKSMITVEIETRTCPVCGDEFERKANYKSTHCSVDCSNITNGKIRKERNRNELHNV